MLDHKPSHLIYGYARASTREESLAHQEAELRAMGAEVIVSERCSTAQRRTKLESLLQELQRGDHLYVARVDHLACTLTDAHRIATICTDLGVTLRYGDIVYNAADPVSKYAYHQLAAIAEFERDLLIAREAA